MDTLYMDKLASLTKKIEVEFLRVVAESLRCGGMTLVMAKEAGKEFLTLLPFLSEEDMEKKVRLFVDKYLPLEKLHEKLIIYTDQQKTSSLLQELRSYIKTS